MLSAFLASRYVRIRSWKDVVAIAVMVVLYIILDFVLGKVFPNMNERLKKIIIYIAVLVVGLIMLFGLDA